MLFKDPLLEKSNAKIPIYERVLRNPAKLLAQLSEGTQSGHSSFGSASQADAEMDHCCPKRRDFVIPMLIPWTLQP